MGIKTFTDGNNLTFEVSANGVAFNQKFATAGTNPGEIVVADADSFAMGIVNSGMCKSGSRGGATDPYQPGDCPAVDFEGINILTCAGAVNPGDFLVPDKDGNGVAVDLAPTITFSAQPTKTECDKLLALVQDVVKVLSARTVALSSTTVAGGDVQVKQF